jgi:hypothetical protein
MGIARITVGANFFLASARTLEGRKEILFRKEANFLRVENPQRESNLAQSQTGSRARRRTAPTLATSSRPLNGLVR